MRYTSRLRPTREPRRFFGRTRSAVASFVETEASGGSVLLVAATAAMLWANLGGGYADFWHRSLTVGGVERDLRHWVNDGLMTIFFLVVGLEIKRELVGGELQDRRVAALPAAAAIGGMAVPAALYAAIAGGGASRAGWGIPMATDIAFVVGAVALLGSRVPSGLRVFLLSLAIVDDIGAIVVIAIFYSRAIDWISVSAAALALASVVLLRARRVVYATPYLIAGALAWLLMLPSGVHPTIAGVALGLLIPAEHIGERSLLDKVERSLHPLSSYVVVPLFALANVGLALSTDAIDRAATSRVFWAVAIGLLAGKAIGIAGTSWLMQRLRLGRSPSGVTTRDLTGGALLAGIGFTVSLFIAALAFTDQQLAGEAHMGILFGSVTSAIVGVSVLGWRRTRDGEAKTT